MMVLLNRGSRAGTCDDMAGSVVIPSLPIFLFFLPPLLLHGLYVLTWQFSPRPNLGICCFGIVSLRGTVDAVTAWDQLVKVFGMIHPISI